MNKLQKMNERLNWFELNWLDLNWIEWFSERMSEAVNEPIYKGMHAWMNGENYDDSWMNGENYDDSWYNRFSQYMDDYKDCPIHVHEFPMICTLEFGDFPAMFDTAAPVPCAFPGGERRRTLQDGGTTPLADLLEIIYTTLAEVAIADGTRGCGEENTSIHKIGWYGDSIFFLKWSQTNF